MSAYSGTPTLLRKFERGDRFGKFVEFVKDLSITLSSQGSTASPIPASALGFSSIYSVQFVNFVNGSSDSVALIVFTDGTNVYTADPTTSTDADRGDPTDVTGTLTIRVSGRPA